MPEDMLISVLQGRFSAPQCKGTGASVPRLQGKLRHWGGMICAAPHTQTAGELEKQQEGCWEQQAAWRAGHNTEVSNSSLVPTNPWVLIEEELRGSTTGL